MEQIQGSPIFVQLHEMKQRMDELFSESFKTARRGSDTAEATGQMKAWEPLTDIWESDDSWVLIMDLPGVAYEDLHVELAENRLIVKGMRKPHQGNEEMEATQIERSQGAFSRIFVLPGNIREETVRAELKQGEFTVQIAKEPRFRATQQRVQVRTG